MNNEIRKKLNKAKPMPKEIIIKALDKYNKKMEIQDLLLKKKQQQSVAASERKYLI